METKPFFIRLPADLHKKIKAYCVENEVKLKDLIIEYIKGLK